MSGSKSFSDPAGGISVRRRLDFALYEAARLGARVERVVLTAHDAGDLAREMMASGVDGAPSGYRGHTIHFAVEGDSRLETRIYDVADLQGRGFRIAV